MDTLENTSFVDLTAEVVRQQLLNLRQLVFEVTDNCNLKCKYCGYGELYVVDGQTVKAGALLTAIENAAEMEDVFELKKLLANYMDQPEKLNYYLLQHVWQLGDIQSVYVSLASKDISVRDYRAAVGQLLASIRRWEMD